MDYGKWSGSWANFEGWLVGAVQTTELLVLTAKAKWAGPTSHFEWCRTIVVEIMIRTKSSPRGGQRRGNKKTKKANAWDFLWKKNKQNELILSLGLREKSITMPLVALNKLFFGSIASKLLSKQSRMNTKEMRPQKSSSLLHSNPYNGQNVKLGWCRQLSGVSTRGWKPKVLSRKCVLKIKNGCDQRNKIFEVRLAKSHFMGIPMALLKTVSVPKCKLEKRVPLASTQGLK